MPTLLGLCGIPIPQTVEGSDFSALITGTAKPDKEAALIMCPSPFGEWNRVQGKEYRGVRTRRHTYVKDLEGAWLLYDNEADPYQTHNLADDPEHAELQARMEELLAERLKATNDEFLPGVDYVKKWKYETYKNGTVPI
jgi:arylsulfatase A-like enzyme